MDAQFCRVGHAFFRSVLGVPQDGAAEIGAVEPELVGASGYGVQLQPGRLGPSFQHPVFRDAGFAVGVDFPQQAGKRTPGNGGGDGALHFRRGAVYQGVIGFPGLFLLQKGMNVGIFSQKHDAKGRVFGKR